MENDDENVPPPTRDQFEHRKDFVRAYDRWRDKHDPRRKARAKARTEAGYGREMYVKHREKRLEEKRTYYEREQDRLRVERAEWRSKNPDKIREWGQRRYQKSAGLFLINNEKRKQQLRKATPAWLTKEQLQKMAEIYEDAAYMTRTTGVVHVVDHIWPLRGKNSCGLHVPWNLRVTPKRFNSRKGNKEPTDG